MGHPAGDETSGMGRKYDSLSTLGMLTSVPSRVFWIGTSNLPLRNQHKFFSIKAPQEAYVDSSTNQLRY